VPDALLHNATISELQSFATDVAQHVSAAHQDLFRQGGQPAAQGALISVGGRILIGIPPIDNFLITE
jgi:hypothetical protein